MSNSPAMLDLDPADIYASLRFAGRGLDHPASPI